MAEDNDLEKRAIEELLRETDRARVRAETMGPAGWLKCPLKSTNKRFLLNTLRSTGLHRRSDESKSESASRGRLRSESPDRRRERSRSPPRHRERHGDHRDKCHREDNSSMSVSHRRREKEEQRHERHTREKKHDRGHDGQKKHRHKWTLLDRAFRIKETLYRGQKSSLNLEFKIIFLGNVLVITYPFSCFLLIVFLVLLQPRLNKLFNYLYWQAENAKPVSVVFASVWIFLYLSNQNNLKHFLLQLDQCC